MSEIKGFRPSVVRAIVRQVLTEHSYTFLPIMNVNRLYLINLIHYWQL